MFDGAEYSSGSECFTNNNQQNDALTSSSSSKKKKSKNKIRFSDEQIRSLEVMFESETKLDPRKKVQLAKDLGLQPRQVAIWFQNKRARWKSKQIEKDYSVLLADYNNLASQFDNLKKENQSLLTQLQQLKNEMLDEHEEKENHCQIQETGGNNNSNSSSDGEESNDCKKKMEFDNDTMNNVIIGSRCFEDDNNSNSSIKAEFLGSLDDENDHELLAMAADSSLTSVDEWGSLESDDLMHHHHHPTQSCQWWDFWS